MTDVAEHAEHAQMACRAVPQVSADSVSRIAQVNTAVTMDAAGCAEHVHPASLAATNSSVLPTMIVFPNAMQRNMG